MTPMVAQTRRAEMPVRFRSQVKTMPSPQMLVRKVTNDTASESLERVVSAESVKEEKGEK